MGAVRESIVNAGIIQARPGKFSPGPGNSPWSHARFRAGQAGGRRPTHCRMVGYGTLRHLAPPLRKRAAGSVRPPRWVGAAPRACPGRGPRFLSPSDRRDEGRASPPDRT